MIKIKRLALPLFALSLLLSLAFVAGCGGTSNASNTTGKTESSGPKVAPDFEVKTLTGETVTYASLKKPLVLNFAASWCGPCELEAPVLAKLHQKYKDKITFFGLAVRDTLEDQTAFAQKHSLSFPIGLDPSAKIIDSYQKAAKVTYSGIPTTFFIDKEGTIVSFYIGPLTESLFEQRAKPLLEP